MIWRNHHVGKNLLQCTLEQITSIFDVEEKVVKFTCNENGEDIFTNFSEALYMFMDDVSEQDFIQVIICFYLKSRVKFPTGETTLFFND